ncbi:MAG: MarR family winged helix-turn-helix transcriptional regulator [Agromyces sp.]
MASTHTRAETERQVDSLLAGLPLDFEAMAVVSNLFRAANAVRSHLERSVLQEHGLSWTAFVVLWVTWIWAPVETRAIAEEGAFSKATLTGVLKTLEAKKLAKRTRSAEDGRLVLVDLPPRGRSLMESLFPSFNTQEARIVTPLSAAEKHTTAEALRKITGQIEQLDSAAPQR